MPENTQVIKLIAKPVRREVFKNGSGEVNLGDRSMFTHALFADDEEIGFDGGACTVVRIEEDGTYFILCNVSMMLEDGTISFQTFVEEVFPPPPFYAAITGGTGAYAGARGEMHIDPASPDIHHYTLHIEVPSSQGRTS
jgi:hypothetical protein